VHGFSLIQAIQTQLALGSAQGPTQSTLGSSAQGPRQKQEAAGNLGTAAVGSAASAGRGASVSPPSFVILTHNPELTAMVVNASEAGTGTGTGTQRSATTPATTTAAEQQTQKQTQKQKLKQKQKQQQLRLSASYYPLVFSEKDTDWREVIERNAELQLRHLPKRLKGLGSTEEFMRVEH